MDTRGTVDSSIRQCYIAVPAAGPDDVGDRDVPDWPSDARHTTSARRANRSLVLALALTLALGLDVRLVRVRAI